MSRAIRRRKGKKPVPAIYRVPKDKEEEFSLNMHTLDFRITQCFINRACSVDITCPNYSICTREV